MREGSIFELADFLVKETELLLKTVKTEEDLRVGFEKLLEPVLRKIGVETSPRYERLSERARTIYKGRPDAVHGRVIIEYEAPGSFKSERNISHAYEQLTQYMTAESFDSSFKSIAGVGFDGRTIFFVRYAGKNGNGGKGRFTLYGPYTFNVDSARTFLAYIRGLARLPLTAENLAARFGPKSDIAPLAVSAVLDALENWGNTRTAVYFDEWKRLFGIVYGEQFASGGAVGAAELARLYGIKERIGFQDLLFSVHTYFALLMKLITEKSLDGLVKKLFKIK